MAPSGEPTEVCLWKNLVPAATTAHMLPQSQLTRSTQLVGIAVSSGQRAVSDHVTAQVETRLEELHFLREPRPRLGATTDGLITLTAAGSLPGGSPR
jgi:hypothetical protein